MLPCGRPPGPLDQLRQQGEDRGGEASRGGRLARRQADLPLGQGEPRQRIHQQQHVLALVAEIFGDGGGRRGRLGAHQGRLVARGHHDHALGQPGRPQVALDELVDLAAAFADQGDDDHVGGRVAGHHSQQHALAHARAGKNPHPLPLAAGQQRRRSRERPWPAARRFAGGCTGRAAGGQATCGRPSAGCGLPSMALPSASITRPSSSGPTRSQRVVRTSRTRLPRRTPPRSLKRIQHRQIVAESHHLGQQRRARLPLDLGHGAHRRRKPGRRNGRADRPRNAAHQAPWA